MVREGRAIDWSCAEALAVGSLLLESIPVRMSARTRAAAPSASATPCSTT